MLLPQTKVFSFCIKNNFGAPGWLSWLLLKKVFLTLYLFILRETESVNRVGAERETDGQRDRENLKQAPRCQQRDGCRACSREP